MHKNARLLVRDEGIRGGKLPWKQRKRTKCTQSQSLIGRLRVKDSTTNRRLAIMHQCAVGEAHNNKIANNFGRHSVVSKCCTCSQLSKNLKKNGVVFQSSFVHSFGNSDRSLVPPMWITGCYSQ